MYVYHEVQCTTTIQSTANANEEWSYVIIHCSLNNFSYKAR
jgi:hypothetical protein